MLILKLHPQEKIYLFDDSNNARLIGFIKNDNKKNMRIALHIDKHIAIQRENANTQKCPIPSGITTLG